MTTTTTRPTDTELLFDVCAYPDSRVATSRGRRYLRVGMGTGTYECEILVSRGVLAPANANAVPAWTADDTGATVIYRMIAYVPD